MVETLDQLKKAVELVLSRGDVALVPDLARNLTNLGVRLGDLGRREEALSVMQEAVVFYRRLAEQRPEVFVADLAGSLNDLSEILSGLGRCEAALEVAEEAVAIRRDLAKSRPEACLPDLAMSLNNLGNRLGTWVAVRRPWRVRRRRRRSIVILPRLVLTHSCLTWREASTISGAG